MIQEKEFRLMRLPYIVGLTYDEKLIARKLIQRGADATLLYFWFNVTHGNYGHLPQAVLYKDADRMVNLFPVFAEDIQSWVNPIISAHFKIVLDYGRQAS